MSQDLSFFMNNIFAAAAVMILAASMDRQYLKI